MLCCGSDPSDTSHHGSQLLLFAEEDRRNMMGIESLQKAQMHKYYIFILNICVSAEKKRQPISHIGRHFDLAQGFIAFGRTSFLC